MKAQRVFVGWSPRLGVLALGLIAIGWSWYGSGRFGNLTTTMKFQNVWFDADSPAIFFGVTNLQAWQRTNKHPLFPALAYPPVKVLRLAGLSMLTATRIWVALVAGIWMAGLCAVLEATHPRLWDRLVFGALGLTSAATLFFSPLPETYFLGSTAMLAALWMVAAPAPRDGFLLAANVLTLGTTVTNWMAGLVVTIAERPPKRTVLIATVAFAAVAGVAALQNRVFTKSDGMFFIPAHVTEDVSYIARPEAGSFVDRWRVFWLSSVVLPEPRQITLSRNKGPFPALSIQMAPQSVTGYIAGGLWGALVLVGLWAIAMEPSTFDRCLVTVVLGQWVLHTAYGSETFLFAPHFVPLLVLVAAQSTRVGGVWARAAAVALLAILIVHNVSAFDRAVVVARAVMQT